MQAQVLDLYIRAFSLVNDIPPQLKSFIIGLKALNENKARVKAFVLNDKFYTIMVPIEHFKGVNISTKTRKFIAEMLVKKDIKTVSVYEFNSVLEQVFNVADVAYAATYTFLRMHYNDKCRHTVIKYYALDSLKKWPLTNIIKSKKC